MKNDIEIFILDVLKRFEEVSGIHARAAAINGRPGIMLSAGVDELRFFAVVRNNITRAGINSLRTELKGIKENSVLISNYVTPGIRDDLEKSKINFIDAAGNAFIKALPLFISVKGNKPLRVRRAESTGPRFYAAGIKVIFALLCVQGAERRTMREIAALSGVTHGAAHLTLKELERQKFIVTENKIKKLVNKKELLRLWAVLYEDRMKQKLIIGRYRGGDIEAAKLRTGREGIFLGGETAAAVLTGYLQPFFHTIYLSGENGNFIFRNRLKKDPSGNFILLKKFWNFEMKGYPDLAPPVLIYADLISTGDPRNSETAEMIYENEIVRYFR